MRVHTNITSKITSKSGLAIVLSKLKGFEKPKVRAEQYMTEAEIAAEMLWLMFLRREIEGKVIADLGSGTGILGFGALLLGAKKVFLVDNDKDAIETARQNHAFLVENGFKLGDAVFRICDVNEFDENVDVVVENPPFGTRQEHIDRVFLEKAFSVSPVVWSFHKSSTAGFVEAFSKDSNFKVTDRIRFRFPLHSAYAFHRRKIHRIDVTMYRIEKQKQKQK